MTHGSGEVVKRGSLYVDVTVLPLYLHDFTTEVEINFCDLESPDASNAKAKGEYGQIQDKLVGCLHRGWIFQELAFGPLDRGIVFAFVKACLALSTKADIDGSRALLEVLRRRPYATTRLSKEVRGLSQATMEAMSVAVWVKACALNLEAMDAEGQLDAAVETIVGRQECDLSDPFTALALIEGFGKTEFTAEADSVFATLQTAASLTGFAGIGPVTAGPICLLHPTGPEPGLLWTGM